MNGRHWIMVGVVVVLVALLWLRPFGGSSKAPQADGGAGGAQAMRVDDAALADPAAFVARLDKAPTEVLRKTMTSLSHQQPVRYPAVFNDVLAHSSRVEVREAAIVAWRRAGKLDAQLMVNLFENDPSRTVRTQAAAAIADQRVWEGVPALVNGLRDPDPHVRDAAHRAVVKVLGTDLGYKVNDPPERREEIIARYEANLRLYESYNRDYKRLLEIQKKAKKGG